MVVVLPGSAALNELRVGVDLGVQLYFDDYSYKVMFAALREVMEARGNRAAYLRDVWLGKTVTWQGSTSSVLINDSVFSDSDVTAAKNVISEFFTLFGDQQYQKMNTLCAGDAASLDFSCGVFGMKEAKLKSCTYNGDYSARANKLVFECSFTMKPTANSVYDPNQTSTSCLIYVRKVGSQFWIDEFASGF